MIGRGTPSVRTWFPDEIENTIRAIDQANNDVAQHIRTPEMQLYRLGYEAAIDDTQTDRELLTWSGFARTLLIRNEFLFVD